MTAQEWLSRWPNFTPEEVYSPDALVTHKHILCPHSLDLLQKLRSELGVRIVVNFLNNRRRGVRTTEDNSEIRGAANSMHLHGRAFDIHSPDMPLSSLHTAAVKFVGFNGIGLYNTWVHIDTRLSLDGSKTTWNNQS